MSLATYVRVAAERELAELRVTLDGARGFTHGLYGHWRFVAEDLVLALEPGCLWNRDRGRRRR